MSLLSLNQVSLKLGTQLILDEAAWQIHAKECIALVGRNGAGKSTLLKVLEGQILPDSGNLQKQSGLSIAYLMQDVPVGLDKTVYHLLVHQLGLLGEILQRYHEADLAKDSQAISLAHAAIDTAGAWDILPQIDAIASHLDLPLDISLSQLSGGGRRRALLGAALLTKADLLLLDEPTNHLDIHTILWLEAYLKQYPGTVITITHDRAFLKSIATQIVEIDRGQLYTYDCNYETYLDRKEAMRITEITHNQLFDKKLKEEEAWLRQGIKARRTRNEGRVRQLQALRETYRARRLEKGHAKAFSLDTKNSGKLVLEAKNISYSLNGKTLIHDFSSSFMRGDKVGILGPNGCGKTTLIRLLLGEITPSAGSIRQGTNLNIAYFDQLRQTLDEQQTVMESIGQGSDHVTINGKPKHVASYLRDFLFLPEQFKQPVFSLSGGERNRLLLARLFAKPINLLIMDEPTNDLDLETLELLETMLLEYTGTLLLISHDRDFLDNIVSHVLVFEKEGHVAEHVGGYQDYCEYKQRLTTPQKKIKPSKTPKVNSAETRELKALPKKIEKLEQQIEAVQLEMAVPGFYEQPAATINALTDQLAILEASLKSAYDRWEALEKKI